MILPAVLLLLALGGMLAGTLATVATLGQRGSHAQEQRLRQQWAVEEGLAIAMRNWSARSLAERALGDLDVAQIRTAGGSLVQVIRRRTHPLVVRVTASGGGQQLVQWLWLAAPSVPALPVMQVVPAGDTASSLGGLVATMVERLRDQTGSGEPAARHRALYHGASEPFVARHPDFAGLAVAHGDFEIPRSMRIHGVLVVTGALRCRGGALMVRGGIIVVTEHVPLVAAPCVEVHPDRTAIEEALAFVAVPKRAPFYLRHWRADGPF